MNDTPTPRTRPILELICEQNGDYRGLHCPMGHGFDSTTGDIERDATNIATHIRDHYERELAQSQARETQLREALTQYAESANWQRNACFDPGGMMFEGIGIAESALAANPPPVVPIAIAEQLAEALCDLRFYMGCGCQHPACSRCKYDAGADAALAAFEPYKIKV